MKRTLESLRFVESLLPETSCHLGEDWTLLDATAVQLPLSIHLRQDCKHRLHLALLQAGPVVSHPENSDDDHISVPAQLYDGQSDHYWTSAMTVNGRLWQSATSASWTGLS